jgi:hypothetical protein
MRPNSPGADHATAADPQIMRPHPTGERLNVYLSPDIGQGPRRKRQFLIRENGNRQRAPAAQSAFPEW